DAGYVHYEISNFARPGRECRHNLSYWRDEEYLGLGVSAAFHWNGNRYKNADDISMYSSLVNRGDWPLVSPESSDEEREMRTAVVLGLRLAEGIDVAAFRNRFGRDIQEYYGDTIEKYVDDGRLILDGSKLHLSPKAYFISDGIFADLI
ncbi:MAG: coproporphyrinogen III oxidase, partial [bacterium]|nr:coproporphyrinogen III oxidase [bacterium]